jgi:hypothetical protein
MTESDTEAGDITSQIRAILHDARYGGRPSNGGFPTEVSGGAGKFRLWSWVSFVFAFLLVLNVLPQEESYLFQRLVLLLGFLAAFLIAGWNLHCSNRASKQPAALTPDPLTAEPETKPRSNKPGLRRIS